VIMRLCVQVLKTASCRNAGEDCVHKTQSGRTLPRTLRKWELHVPGCPFLDLDIETMMYGLRKAIAAVHLI
jgi:hypothetical protein